MGKKRQPTSPAEAPVPQEPTASVAEEEHHAHHKPMKFKFVKSTEQAANKKKYYMRDQMLEIRKNLDAHENWPMIAKEKFNRDGQFDDIWRSASRHRGEHQNTSWSAKHHKGDFSVSHPPVGNTRCDAPKSTDSSKFGRSMNARLQSASSALTVNRQFPKSMAEIIEQAQHEMKLLEDDDSGVMQPIVHRRNCGYIEGSLAWRNHLFRLSSPAEAPAQEAVPAQNVVEFPFLDAPTARTPATSQARAPATAHVRSPAANHARTPTATQVQAPAATQGQAPAPPRQDEYPTIGTAFQRSRNSSGRYSSSSARARGPVEQPAAQPVPLSLVNTQPPQDIETFAQELQMYDVYMRRYMELLYQNFMRLRM
ncbi:hypothetical protein QR680_011324 [Steinernema hermaphroditum]|uniref:Uncharacterized protein n=1 Tax=Steinernema hermaphroditum TaxID=289476 RepID=A0AA39IT36_9BILA|nr:hypothetical protein QR680_011324 [Steinernema hermaphroditum]